MAHQDAANNFAFTAASRQLCYSIAGTAQRGQFANAMPLLIDGHNLIGQLTTIRLGEDDDEALLVTLLRRYVRNRNARLIVVFDRGMPGHTRRLDGGGVEVIFVPAPGSADDELIRRLQELRQPASWQLVSSDREVAQVAKRRGVVVIPAQEFADRLESGLRAPLPRPDPDAKPLLKVGEHELPEWLALFGIDPADAEREDLPLPPAVPLKQRRKRRR